MKELDFWVRLVVGLGAVAIGVALLDRVVQLARISPLLAIMVTGLLILAAVIIGRRFFRAKPPKPEVKEFQHRVEAAQENLTALESQLDKIQDQVAQEALRYHTTTLRQTMSRQEPQLVVFGVGAAGKTSLVNALMGHDRGAVAATMGTTELGVKYRPVKLGEFTVSLTDCPGILEAGAVGADREELARKLATRADLLLFVIDDDLRQTEFQLLQELATLGKKIILVFNKTDRLPKPDRELICQSIQQRLASAGLAIPLTAIAARPQAVALPTGETYYPPPKLAPLLAELTTILATQTPDLIADNILLQCQSLTTEARSVLSQQREQLTQQIIDRYQWIVAGAVVANPIPLADFLATAAVHTQMVMEIAQVYDCQISREDSQSLVKSIIQTFTALGMTKTVLQIMSMTLNPLGILVKTTIGGLTAAYLTRIAGRSFQEYFAHQENWGDGGISKVVERQFNLAQKEELLQTVVQQTLNHLKIKPPSI
ncbi:MAG: GTP-binding protein [Cyanobacteria bacterium KgW148]|nr:GTP-binding protein [Cyanobacteria bacterium KgW148]